MIPRERRELDCRGRRLELGPSTLVMGILNVTPDSFSDGGAYVHPEAALARARAMVEEGADLIDVGGESTRPGASPVPEQEELRRVLPVVEALAAELSVPISIDTQKSAVAASALLLGAHMVNDIWGLQGDRGMARVCADAGVPIVVMHNKVKAGYVDLMDEVTGFLRVSIATARDAGIAPESIIIDPGIGFGKTFADNLALMAHLERLVELGHPILLGASRKSFIGHILGLSPAERIEGTVATSVIGALMGVDIVRVHDVQATVRALRVTDRVVEARRG